MAQDYTEYLAANVLNEQQIVTYRLLGRALKVHCNLAKQMLYEFHRKQNTKRPGSVHATYLIAGTRQVERPSQQPNGTHSQQDGDDTVMRSSPGLPSSSLPQQADEDLPETEPVLVRSVMLAKQEDLEKAKAVFDSISSIHIYSLEASKLDDLQILSECNRKIAVDYASEDPLEVWKQYGTIQNPNVKRRTRRTAPPAPSAPAVNATEIKAKPSVPTTKVESKPSSAKPTPEPEKKETAKKPAPTKRQSSDIFKSFAKSKTKPKGESQSSAEATPAPEDEKMGGFSEDEGEDDAEEPAGNDVVPTGKSKKDRQAELEAMMDQEDEEMEDADTPAAAEAEEPEVTIDKASDEKMEEPKETVTVEGGRRRGRRRVMKKKTVKDEEGYLVTKEEAAWESFSEDEPPPKKAKLPSATPSNSSGKGAAKKGAKPQGNIMSFFGKK